MEASQIDASTSRSVAVVDGRRISVGRGVGIDGRIEAIAMAQRARVARAQLLLAGVSASAIDRRLRNGRLTYVHEGVYALAYTRDIALGAETAAVLACGEGASLSHHSAATLWGLRPGTARPVHVTIPADRGGPDLAGVRVHRCQTLIGQDIRLHDGLPVTSPARTLLDIADTLTDRDVERLLDEAMFVRRVLTVAQINALIARAGNHPGRSRLARVAGAHTRSTRTDSPPEEALLDLIRAAGLPQPELQAAVLGYRIDFFWPALALAVEVDAYGTHGSPAQFEADRRRDARLLSQAGITVIRLTRAAVEERPLEATGTLARAIGSREAR